ncbi:hypothetical protein FZI85_24630 [Mycobacterium sp. CBMA293]|nr:hypothetical protein [Mycolicibacterium sp. CBMA 360]MUL60262.1 hypothetical protein [Mycolicibacterium sp. CBMA 335]MUL71526.1 hypothetical protein [Mycolicibacterium sp. CBMA 311]MUL95976.1 hypothetical protein [Mycolicibacterium sp. CBMA 230]MUM08367.1 hypothetical protein [Mycolicibacterium sp. CBMA 213]MUM14200.1 hypothetical protein [Mycolicibacterium sp. CBMA 293]MUM33193.1 hypothetical protein [Mycolicibacterium sp. CBMA 361]
MLQHAVYQQRSWHLNESLKRQAQLAREFNRMRKVYRNALPEITSTARWESSFDSVKETAPANI